MKTRILFFLMLFTALVMVGCSDSTEPANGNGNGNGSDTPGTSTSDIASTNKVTNVFGTVYEVILKNGNRMYFMVSGPNTVIMTAYPRFYGYADEDNDNFAMYGYKGELTVPSSIVLDGKEYTVVSVEAMGNILENNTLTSVKLPNSVTIIGNGAFAGCMALKTINIPNTVVKIDIAAFAYCESLVEIDVPEGVKELHSRTFFNCYNLTKITGMDGITKTFGDEFQNCRSLKSIRLAAVQTLAMNDFSGCSALEEIELPSIQTLNEMGLFEGCTSLKKIVFGSALTRIGWIVEFADCTNLKDVYCYAAEPPSNGSDMTEMDFVLHVPAASINSYRESYDWSYDAEYEDGRLINHRVIVAIEE